MFLYGVFLFNSEKQLTELVRVIACMWLLLSKSVNLNCIPKEVWQEMWLVLNKILQEIKENRKKKRKKCAAIDNFLLLSKYNEHSCQNNLLFLILFWKCNSVIFVHSERN